MLVSTLILILSSFIAGIYFIKEYYKDKVILVLYFALIFFGIAFMILIISSADLVQKLDNFLGLEI